MKKYLSFLLLPVLAGCTEVRERGEFEQLALVPVYLQLTETEIGLSAPVPTVTAGKIYAYGNYLFQVDQYKGIHIMDNAVPSAARKVAFLKVPRCTEIAIKANHLYTNHLNDLVVFDLAQSEAPRLVNRIKDAFPGVQQDYPPVNNVAFECPDPARGIVIGWEEKMVKNPACRR